MQVIKGWQKNFIAMKERGFNDHECCQRAGVSGPKLSDALHHDVEFKRQYDEAEAKSSTGRRVSG
jgi:hypothetical protein